MQLLGNQVFVTYAFFRVGSFTPNGGALQEPEQAEATGIANSRDRMGGLVSSSLPFHAMRAFGGATLFFPPP